MLRGNHLRKRRVNLSISDEGLLMLAEIANRKRISASSVLELWITEGYEECFGKGSRPVKPEMTRVRN